MTTKEKANNSIEVLEGGVIGNGVGKEGGFM